MMNRQQVIAKIQSMLKLQEGTDFEGEASAAAKLIDKLCKQYNVSVSEATETQIFDESFATFKRINNANAILLNAVANFYDAKAYIKTADVKSLQIIGSEAQQIQVKLYFDYLYQVMEKEADVAYTGEKVLSQLTGGSVSRSFKTNFKKAFADKVALRLKEMKIKEGRCHEDAEAVRKNTAKLALKNRKMTGASGAGAFAGADCGGNVSLRRQANGSAQRALCGV